MQTRTIISLVVALVVLGGAGWYVYQDVRTLPGSVVPNGTGGINGGATTTDNGPTITILPPQPSLAELDRPLVFTNAHLTEDQKKAIEAKVAQLTEDLRKNPGYYEAWVDLGINRKEAGDYEGARDAWERATVIDAGRSVAYGNLGVVYGTYLGDQTKAIKNFEKAISIDSHYLYLYGQYSDFYRNIVKNTEKAKEVLRRAQTASPSDREAIQKIIDSF